MWKQGNEFNPKVAGYYWRKMVTNKTGQGGKIILVILAGGKLLEYEPFVEKGLPFNNSYEYWDIPIEQPNE